jgi:predicted aldo/keto reductase-like oxidoreductase
MVQKPSDIQNFFNEQMERLDTEYLDFYLLHGLNRHTWANMKAYGAMDYIEKFMSEGTVRHTGFSFHDEVRIFKEIVDGYDWTLCQIQYNFFDENRQAGREGLQYAASKGMGVVIMEPLRGGSLTGNLPPSVQAIWDSADVKRTPAEWGLRWVLNQPEVSLVLSGMSAMAQVIENIKVVEDAKAGSLSEEELALVRKVQEKYEEMLKVDCTGCGYCMPCQNGVDIPMNFGAYNDYYIFADHRPAFMRYNRMMADEQKASNCQECGECEEKCPQEIGITDELKKVHALLHNEEESNL